MAALFVPYTPDVEDDDPHFDRNLQTVIDKTKSYIAESVTAGGTGRALRDAHAKGYGLVRGEVEILDGLPPSTPKASTRLREPTTHSSASPTARLTPEPTRDWAPPPDWR
ncbi:hypothetical protein [Streptomyces sp. AcE210]|uniref:hypothetical protein n=1 Tax=Streptomyces sp. AcE210 TaxID=2292703 RepID=UPI001F0B7C0E|nr:hypothetical protein [Streptomyces sp. AcE210]